MVNTFFWRKIFPQLTGASKLVSGETVYSLVLQMGWLHASGTTVGQASSANIFVRIKNIFDQKNSSSPSEPVGKPGHVAVTVERVGDQVETCQTAENKEIVENIRRKLKNDLSYAIKNQRKARNAPSRGHFVPKPPLGALSWFFMA